MSTFARSTGAAAPTPLTFSFSTLPLRVIMRGDEPWFVAADVCDALSIGRTDDGVRRLDEDEKGTDSIRTPGGTQQMVVINESGLYSLILGSRKPEAKRFKKWVTSEVLPAIRKTGRYEHTPEPKPEPKPVLVQDRDLSQSDMQVIRDRIEDIAQRFRWHKAWRMGMWHHLRAKTGVASPKPFQIKHVDTLGRELYRLEVVAVRLSNAFADAESECIAKVLRGGVTGEALKEVLGNIARLDLPRNPSTAIR
jgi:prophage antirepressor-like protein